MKCNKIDYNNLTLHEQRVTDTYDQNFYQKTRNSGYTFRTLE